MDERLYEKIYQANVKLVDDNSTLKKDIEILERRINKTLKYVRELKTTAPEEVALDEIIELLTGEKIDDKELELS